MILERMILDACCSLNLYATGEMKSILELLPYRYVIGVRAHIESQWLQTDQPGERETVDLSLLFDSGLLEEQSMESPREMELFVALGAWMEEGEAEAAALVINRGFTLATDDRKARRVLADQYPTLRLLGTVDLLFDWQARARLSTQECREALQKVSIRASFVPPRADPRREWWLSLIES